MATLKGINKDGLKSKLEELSKEAGAKPIEGAPTGMKDLAQFIDKVRDLQSLVARPRPNGEQCKIKKKLQS